jgi:ADP-ribosyl-[dinitrogen reductase] hydrolase
MGMSTSSATGTLSMMDRKKSAMFGLFVADATAMPVHWMYNLEQLRHDYGEIRGYVKPKDEFYGSIMNLSNTGGGGRGSDQGNIVGDIILHGKKKYWMRGGNFHYHLGLQAGENTLEAQLVRVLSKSIADRGVFDAKDFRDRYIQFMTTPGSHSDTYASTCHRMFFANYVRGVPPEQCADNDGHNTDAIDALTLTVPVIIKYADAPAAERIQKVSRSGTK